MSASGYAEKHFDGAGDIYVDPESTPQAGAAVPAVEEGDLRILPVHYERDGRRFRRLQDCQLEYEEDAFDDWPFEGDRSVGHACRELRRAGLSWLQHHDNWKRLAGIDANDKSAHEHLAICTALHYLACYDQVLLPNLAGCEAMNSRRMLIEHAHEHAAGGRPRWEGGGRVSWLWEDFG